MHYQCQEAVFVLVSEVALVTSSRRMASISLRNREAVSSSASEATRRQLRTDGGRQYEVALRPELLEMQAQPTMARSMDEVENGFVT